MSGALEVTSEIAYDLVQEHLDTLLALLDRPLARADALTQLGSPAALERLLRHGLVEADGDELRAVAGVYHQLRQEGMATFLRRYVLPALSASIDDGRRDATQLDNLRLSLEGGAMRALRAGRVQALFERLSVISDLPTSGPSSRLTVLVVGTSTACDDEPPAGEAALRHLRAASLQRATPAERELAVLSQLDFLADTSRHAAAREAVRRFLDGFSAERPRTAHEANYHLTVATHWQTRPQAADAGHTRTSC